MAARYRLIDRYAQIPVPGGKKIEEIFGRVNTGAIDFSVAHMVAPAGWGEPRQVPEFGELTIMVRGSMRIEIGTETVELKAGQSLWVEPLQPIRYSNPGAEECEYFAVCFPAFSPDLAHRD